MDIRSEMNEMETELVTDEVTEMKIPTDICGPKHENGEYCHEEEVMDRFIESEIEDDEKKKKKLLGGTRLEKGRFIAKYIKGKYGCGDERCWGDYSEIFRVEGVHIPVAEWDVDGDEAFLISDAELINVMEQYNDDQWKFHGVWMDNFISKPAEVRRFHETIDATQATPKWGIIIFINQGKYKHWVCIYVDNFARRLKYFDSNADEGDRRRLIVGIIDEIKKSFPGKYEFEYNSVPIQTDDVNCGLFVIDFMATMIAGDESFDNWVGKYKRYKTKIGKKKYEAYLMKLRRKYFYVWGT